ncbi:hypothetical protein CON96_11530 [Bacillus wiedmannii]|uniref:hypothetical protein n=1 Tax=Bacillus wiedmannii TaxID=1890302 RepID=UPI000BEDEDD1|nr:hypothetical protein [Bacillus wiedmannii]PEG10321.1 hypothetical protein CON96_11530 [Bacillus wiedmannii]
MEQGTIIDWNNIDKSIAELKERIEAHRQARIEKGLPPERPDYFVDRELSKVLSDKVEHLFDYFKKYSVLLVKTRALQPTEYNTIHQKYGDYLLLLNEAIDQAHNVTGRSLRDLLRTMKRIDADEISYEKASREIYYTFKLLDLRSIGINQFTEEPLPEIDEERLEKLRSDESFLQSEVDLYLKHYEEIKHLI